jgi:glycosyltransferase involved in cell wall biosynthesis
MKVAHVVPHIDQEASGPSYSVPRLCQSLAASGETVELLCLAANGPITGIDLQVYRQWPVLGRFAISTSLARSLRAKARDVSVVHNHSLWSMVNVAAGWVVPGTKAALVTSPRGTLSPWALSRTRALKRVLWPLQRRALSDASLLHATSMQEYAEIRALGFDAPVAVIPNGIDLPDMPEQKSMLGWRNLLFLGRIHPTKGIDNLLRAWKMLEPMHPEWRLQIAGRGAAEDVAEIKSLAASLNLSRVDFSGPLYGSEKSRAYHRAELFVLPSHSENFGMVVAEALAHGCPAVVSRGAPWSALQTEKCGWWTGNDPDSLSDTLGTAMQSSENKLTAMGAAGRAWMARDFSWQVVGQRMSAAYQWIVAGGKAPTFTLLD